MKKRASYYDILRITPHASDAEVKRAYLYWAKKFHPDKHPENKAYAELRFNMANEAFQALETREKRLAYNAQIAPKPQNDNTKTGLLSQIGEFFWPQHRQDKRP